MPTTTNEASSVPAKRVDVAVERGCRCGGILDGLLGRKREEREGEEEDVV